LKVLMREYGWTAPILIDEESNVIAGHGRLLAAKELGITGIPVLVARGWSAEKKRAYVLADNRITERGGWDWKLVSLEVQDLKAAGADLTLTGFEAFELEPLLGADWDPPPQKVGDGTNHERKMAIHVSGSQHKVILAAIARARTKLGNPNLTDGAALEYIASEFAK
jgi:hypothetical protein